MTNLTGNQPNTIYTEPNLATMARMEDNSIDAIVTDPPYGLKFMGKKWDHDVPGVDIWKECLRVLKPGGHLLAFAGTRTQHRMACAIEDAGFEIRDMIAWVYGSGFPKSVDISKMIDQMERGSLVREKLLYFAKMRGIDGKWLEENGIASAASFADWTIGGHVPGDKNWNIVKSALEITEEEESTFEREVRGKSKNGIAGGSGMHAGAEGSYGFSKEFDITLPATDAARQWAGWGSALKPALEPVTMARKPFPGTLAGNVITWGTGGINVDGCRVGANEPDMMRIRNTQDGDSMFGMVKPNHGNDLGRFPANLIHDGSDEVVGLFPETKNGGQNATSERSPKGQVWNEKTCGYGQGDPTKYAGGGSGAARFFYCTKASRAERDAGLDDLPIRSGGDACDREDDTDGLNSPRAGAGRNGRVRNFHPTVKPIDLMRYLCRLVTPPGGLVYDPFCGSGTTLIGAKLEGFRWVGSEMDPEYAEIARKRVAAVTFMEQMGLFDSVPSAVRQAGLFEEVES